METLASELASLAQDDRFVWREGWLGVLTQKESRREFSAIFGD
jgi:hypothetical protein